MRDAIRATGVLGATKAQGHPPGGRNYTDGRPVRMVSFYGSLSAYLQGWTKAMNPFWQFLRDKRNQQVLGWLGGGLVVAATGLWVAFVYFFPPGKPTKSPEPSPPAFRRTGWHCHRRRCDWLDHHGGRHDQFGRCGETEMSGPR